MFVHLLQAIVIAVLFMFPFVYDINDFTTSHRTANICATVDSAIVKHYSQTGSLPKKLDAETLKKLGLDEKVAEGMTYEKLEDRKFVLFYEDAKDNVNESIHSRTLLPVNVNTNFGVVEDNEKYYWLELPESPNQTVTVEIKFPDGSMAVLNEGERKEYPADSEFIVNIVADKGFGPGKGLPSAGKLNKDMIFEITEAERSMVKVTLKYPDVKEGIESIGGQILVAQLPKGNYNEFDQYYINRIGETFVPYGSVIRIYGTLLPETSSPMVYFCDRSSYSPIDFAIYEDTVINAFPERIGVKVDVEDALNQTIKVTIDTVEPLPWKNLYREVEAPNQFQIWNGESCIVPNSQNCYMSKIVKVEVVADAGYKPGTPSVTSCPITGDMIVTATPAVKEEVFYPEDIDLGNGWCPVPLYMQVPPYNDDKIHLIPMEKDPYIQGILHLQAPINSIDRHTIYFAGSEYFYYWIKIPEGINKVFVQAIEGASGIYDPLVVKSSGIYWAVDHKGSFRYIFKPPYNMKAESGALEFWENPNPEKVTYRHPWNIYGYYIKVKPGHYYELSSACMASYRTLITYNRRVLHWPTFNEDLYGIPTEDVIVQS